MVLVNDNKADTLTLSCPGKTSCLLFYFPSCCAVRFRRVQTVSIEQQICVLYASINLIWVTAVTTPTAAQSHAHCKPQPLPPTVTRAASESSQAFNKLWSRLVFVCVSAASGSLDVTPWNTVWMSGWTLVCSLAPPHPTWGHALRSVCSSKAHDRCTCTWTDAIRHQRHETMRRWSLTITAKENVWDGYHTTQPL